MTSSTRTTTTTEFDCYGWQDEWSAPQRAWCCSRKRVGCPSTTNTEDIFDCLDWELDWSTRKSRWCCQHEGRRCTTTTRLSTTSSTSTTPSTSAAEKPSSTSSTLAARVSTSSDMTRSIGENQECVQQDVSYEPIDQIDGVSHPFTTEESVADCQARCAKVHGCVHFAFWSLAGHCHIQDKFATVVEGSFDFISGPPSCKAKQEMLPCQELSTSYWPVMQGATKTFADIHSDEDAIAACQQECYGTSRCVRFVMKLSDKTCGLADAAAVKVTPSLDTVSGPRICSSALHLSESTTPCDAKGFSVGSARRHLQRPRTDSRNCFQGNMSYVPDILGQIVTMEANASSCQTRCSHIPSCVQFSYWASAGSLLAPCHVHDKSARAQPGAFGVVSGPPTCTDFLLQNKFLTRTDAFLRQPRLRMAAFGLAVFVGAVLTVTITSRQASRWGLLSSLASSRPDTHHYQALQTTTDIELLGSPLE